MTPGRRPRYFQAGIYGANPSKYGYRLGSENEFTALSMTETTTRECTDLRLNAETGFTIDTIAPSATMVEQVAPVTFPTMDGPKSTSNIGTPYLEASADGDDGEIDWPSRIEPLERCVSDLLANQIRMQRQIDAMLAAEPD